MLPEDWMVKINLKEAYYAVPIHPDFQGLLSFLWNQTQYQFTCLPFGLSCVPWTFTKVMKLIVDFLTERGVRLIIYIDDILLMAQSQALAYQHLLTLDVFEQVGFFGELHKSATSPTQEIDSLELVVNSKTMPLTLPQEKILKIQKEVNLLLSSKYPTARQVARLIHLLSASIPAILHASLHYRHLQRLTIQAVAAGRFDMTVLLTPEAR